MCHYIHDPLPKKRKKNEKQRIAYSQTMFACANSKHSKTSAAETKSETKKGRHLPARSGSGPDGWSQGGVFFYVFLPPQSFVRWFCDRHLLLILNRICASHYVVSVLVRPILSLFLKIVNILVHPTTSTFKAPSQLLPPTLHPSPSATAALAPPWPSAGHPHPGDFFRLESGQVTRATGGTRRQSTAAFSGPRWAAKTATRGAVWHCSSWARAVKGWIC